MSVFIGLTGGIASGKTRVAALFAQYDVPIIDTDEIARSLTENDHTVADDIRRVFGPSVFHDEKQLDRKRLRNIVFSDRDKKKQLEAILHPRIREEVHRQKDSLVDHCYVIIAIALLAEVGGDGYDFLRRVIVVDLPVDRQRARLMRRDGITQQEAQRIIDAQADRAARLAIADDIIDNSGSPEDLPDQIRRLHHHYLSLWQPG